MKSERRGKFGKRKALAFAVLFAMLAFVSIGCASAATHYVDPGESIQAAVDAADPGDTIIVRDGIYTENINVYKRLIIFSENGSASTIVQAAIPDDHVFEITANHVNLSGFAVENATQGTTPPYSGGVYLYYVEHCNISDNTVSNNFGGIGLIYSNNNIISNNNASSNMDTSIGLVSSNNKTQYTTILQARIWVWITLEMFTAGAST